MRIVIDGNDLVTDEVALKMVLAILDRDDGTVRFTKGFAVDIRTAKTQRTFKVLKNGDFCDTSEGKMTDK